MYVRIIYYMTIGKSVPIHLVQAVCIISPVGSKQDQCSYILKFYYRYRYAFKFDAYMAHILVCRFYHLVKRWIYQHIVK